MYKIRLSNRAEKDLDALDELTFERTLVKIKELASNPRPIGYKKLINSNDFRIRVGVFRVLYEIDDKEKIVSIYRVEHRKEVYKKRQLNCV